MLAITHAPRERSQEDGEASASLEAGRLWASRQFVFRAGSFGSVGRALADHTRDGESAKEPRARVNKTILKDLEPKVIAFRALHAKLGHLNTGESFGDSVARGRAKSAML